MYNIIFVFLIILLVTLFIGCNPLIYIIGDGPNRSQLNKRQEEIDTERREKYIIANSSTLTDRQKNLISSDIVDVGLTKEQIINVLGWSKPDKVLSTTKYNANEVWVYDLPRSVKNRKLYFKDNILIKIE